jgi:hypothetical protein
MHFFLSTTIIIAIYPPGYSSDRLRCNFEIMAIIIQRGLRRGCNLRIQLQSARYLLV